VHCRVHSGAGGTSSGKWCMLTWCCMMPTHAPIHALVTAVVTTVVPTVVTGAVNAVVNTMVTAVVMLLRMLQDMLLHMQSTFYVNAPCDGNGLAADM
jgi:hypothetical protein